MTDTRYTTLQPMPSADPRDRWDNSIVLDEAMNSTAETLMDRFGRPRNTLQAFHNLVTSAKNQITVVVNEATTTVNGARDDAVAEIADIVSSLGEDINTAHASTLDALKAKTPKYDGIVGIVTDDPNAANNGWYYWAKDTGEWIRFADQPAMTSAVDRLRRQIGVQKRPRGKENADDPFLIGAAGRKILFGVQKSLPRGPSNRSGALPMLGKTILPPMIARVRPRGQTYKADAVIISGHSVVAEVGAPEEEVKQLVTYDSKLINDQSQPVQPKRIASIISDKVWVHDGFTDTQVTSAGVWLAAQAVAFDMVRALKSGTPAQPHTITKDGRDVRDGKVLFHKLATGQSLALGSRGIVLDPNGEYVINGVRGNLFSPVTPAGYTDKLWTLKGGPRPADWEGSTAFEAVREYVSGVTAETPATSYMLALRKWHERTTSVSPQLLYSVSALGGTAYAGIKKGTATYTNAISQVTTAKAIADSLGLDYSVPGISIVHGESQRDTTQAEYVAMLAEWIGDYRADITAISGQAIPPIGFLSQMTTGETGTIPAIPLAQLQAHEENPSLVMIGPKYAYPYFDTYHMTAEGYIKTGEIEARAERLTQVNGIKWQPLKVVSASASGSVITLKLNNLPGGNAGTPGPIGALTLDTEIVSNPGDYGFQISSGTITGATLGKDGASIAITTAAPVAAGTVITYALQPLLGSPQSGNGRRGCVRDNDMRDFSRYDGKPVYNWLCAFSKELEIL